MVEDHLAALLAAMERRLRDLDRAAGQVDPALELALEDLRAAIHAVAAVARALAEERGPPRRWR